MSDEKDFNFEAFKDPEFNKMLENIKLNCPVKKVNFDIENKFGVTGMYLTTLEKPESVMEPDLSNLKDGTYLFFPQVQISEVIQIIHAILTIFNENGILRYDEFDVIINKIINAVNTPCTYKSFKDKINRICKDHFENNHKISKLYAINISYILLSIWFISYKNIDDISEMAVEDFKRRTGYDDGENKESST